jgi:hypothetical protein
MTREPFRWSVLDPFSPDDPAVRLGREALALRPPEPSASRPAEAAPTVPDRAELASLADLVRRGDRAAAERLRDLLRRARHGR